MANRLVEAINAVYDRFVDGAGAPTLPAPVQSDLEAILWNLAGADVDLPTADTGLEGALANLAEHADEIGGGGDNTITISLNIEGEETQLARVMAVGFIDGDGYLCAAYDNGNGYITEMEEPLSFNPSEVNLNFLLIPEKTFQFGVMQGHVEAVTGDAVYNEEASTEAGSPIYDVSGSCAFTLHLEGH